jgi:FtsP/CotA-like multicopper oxidase with cupredoxin domain
MNDIEQPKVSVQPGKTYYLRVINISGFAQFYLQIEGHNFTIIEVDGVYTEPQPVQNLYISNGQRYGVLMKTYPTSEQNYAILGAMDLTAFDPGAVPSDINPNVTGVLVYNGMSLIHNHALSLQNHKAVGCSQGLKQRALFPPNSRLSKKAKPLTTSTSFHRIKWPCFQASLINKLC